jgi:hypothetical protein
LIGFLALQLYTPQIRYNQQILYRGYCSLEKNWRNSARHKANSLSWGRLNKAISCRPRVCFVLEDKAFLQ